MLRRLAGEALCEQIKARARKKLWPLQVGCCSPLGAETAVHTVRQWCTRNKTVEDKVLLKLDFSNAFNTLNREAVLQQVREHFLELERWVRWTYCEHSTLLFGKHKLLSSQAGVQQGDPLGPLLFSLAVQPVAVELAREGGLDFTAFYLDDGVFAGSTAAVSSALQKLAERCPQLGLHLNLKKCELVVPSGRRPDNLERFFPAELLADPVTGENRVVLGTGFKLLGAPVGPAAYCAAFTQKRVKKVKPTLEALAKLEDPQVALLLLRYCSSFGKLVFSARTTPASYHLQELSAFDEEVRATLSDFCGLDLTESQWKQASRGLWCGGLGLRRLGTHAPAAYFASLSATSKLCLEVDPNYVWSPEVPGSEAAQALAAVNNFCPRATSYRQTGLARSRSSWCQRRWTVKSTKSFSKVLTQPTGRTSSPRCSRVPRTSWRQCLTKTWA